MKIFIKLFVVACGIFLYCGVLSSARSGQTVPYPEGYRYWTHVKSNIAAPDNPRNGIHHIYANSKAMDGYRTGNFADGSIIVFDLLKLDAKNDGGMSVGERRLVDVMHKDSKRFANTGGWGFEEFRGNSRTVRDVGENAAAKCFSCHVGQKERDYVFSSFGE